MTDDLLKTAFQDLLKKPEIGKYRREKVKSYETISLWIRDEGIAATDKVTHAWAELYEEAKAVVHENLNPKFSELEGSIATQLHGNLMYNGAKAACRQPFQKEKFMRNYREIRAERTNRSADSKAHTLQLLEDLGFTMDEKSSRGGSERT